MNRSKHTYGSKSVDDRKANPMAPLVLYLKPKRAFHRAALKSSFLLMLLLRFQGSLKRPSCPQKSQGNRKDQSRGIWTTPRHAYDVLAWWLLEVGFNGWDLLTLELVENG